MIMIRQTLRWASYGLQAAVLVGCNATGNLGTTMGSWQGSNFGDVTAAWGEPDTCDTIDGRRICSWYDMVSGFSLSTAQTCVRSMEIAPDGEVTGWRWRGDSCADSASRILARTQVERPNALAVEADEADDVEVAATQPAE